MLMNPSALAEWRRMSVSSKWSQYHLAVRNIYIYIYIMNSFEWLPFDTDAVFLFLIMIMNVQLARTAAACEVYQGLYLLVELLLPSRNLLMLMMWWQYLQMRYSYCMWRQAILCYKFVFSAIQCKWSNHNVWCAWFGFVWCGVVCCALCFRYMLDRSGAIAVAFRGVDDRITSLLAQRLDIRTVGLWLVSLLSFNMLYLQLVPGRHTSRVRLYKSVLRKTSSGNHIRLLVTVDIPTM